MMNANEIKLFYTNIYKSIKIYTRYKYSVIGDCPKRRNRVY